MYERKTIGRVKRLLVYAILYQIIGIAVQIVLYVNYDELSILEDDFLWAIFAGAEIFSVGNAFIYWQIIEDYHRTKRVRNFSIVAIIIIDVIFLSWQIYTYFGLLVVFGAYIFMLLAVGLKNKG